MYMYFGPVVPRGRSVGNVDVRADTATELGEAEGEDQWTSILRARAGVGSPIDLDARADRVREEDHRCGVRAGRYPAVSTDDRRDDNFEIVGVRAEDRGGSRIAADGVLHAFTTIVPVRGGEEGHAHPDDDRDPRAGDAN